VKLTRRGSALRQRVASYDPIEGVNFGYFPALRSLLHNGKSLFKTAITAAIHGLPIFVNLKKHSLPVSPSL
jgi:hypothetical protein